VIVIGHRGAAALAPENTLAAIEAAASHGADAVELDVRRGRGGGLVLGHDAIEDPDAPTLDAALELADRRGLAVQVDVKERGLELDVVAALRRRGLVERSFVSSTSQRILRDFRAAEPALRRAFTYPDDRFGVSERPLLRHAVAPGLALLRLALPLRLPRLLRRAGASAATLNAGVVGPRVLATCRRRGVAVYVWTVNEPIAASALAEAGADAIITDDPRILAGGTRPA
jgi:glycerophosphoryl diester phosphodiesterase